jgi:hypothetical protein
MAKVNPHVFDFAALWDKAWSAGVVAARGTVPNPMVVTDALTGYTYPPILDGACGFAWVKIKPGNSPFANWLKKNGKARPAYNGGVDIWISDYNQSVARKEAHAGAMAKVFQDAGINAFADSRLD